VKGSPPVPAGSGSWWARTPSGSDDRGVKTFKLVAGAVLLVLGVVWFLQGIGVMGGSAMSGSSVWAVVGPVVAIAGIVLLVSARRPARRS
jgi:uncharacterized membrane protein HdeD (DUF308 family)